MAKSAWLNPTTVVAVAGLALSVASLVIGQMDKERISSLESDRFSLERWKTEAEVRITKAVEERASDAEKQRAERRRTLEAELEKVTSDIAVWEGGVSDTQATLLTLQAELQQYQSENRPIMVEATSKSIEAAEMVLGMKQAELDASRARRTEIEARLD